MRDCSSAPTPHDLGGRPRYRELDLAWIVGLVMLRESGMSIADICVITDLSWQEGPRPNGWRPGPGIGAG
ncbi:hypothetical protein GCM10020220_018480 [Nonomuraea rubra]